MTPPISRQFDLYTSHYDAGEEGSSDFYTLARDRENMHGYADQHGRVEVSHYPSGPISIQNYNQPKWGVEFRQPPAMGEADPFTNETSSGQQELFRERYDNDHPGKSVVGGMYFTKEARAMAMPVLAAAARDTAEQHGRALIASGDRSEHSDRLVNHLDAAGVGGKTERSHSNSIDFSPPSTRPVSVLGDKREPEVLQQGKKTSRQIIRSSRRRRAPVQEELFGG